MLLNRLIEPAHSIPEERRLFSDEMLWALIFPIIIEQLLSMTVGMADTLMISYAGEAAISGVSLVDMINGIFIYVFDALAAGGTIIVSQYIGRRENQKGSLCAGQVITISTLISLAITALILLGNRALLGLLFGAVDASIMQAALTYLVITAFSYPFLAIYSSCAALFRAMGNSRITMRVSLGMNIVNVIGNAIGVFVLHIGVTGVAAASLISRVLACMVLGFLLLRRKEGDSPSVPEAPLPSHKEAASATEASSSGRKEGASSSYLKTHVPGRKEETSASVIYVRLSDIFTFKADMIRQILTIAIPSGIERGFFQVCRVALTSLIATFGMTQIAANGVAVSIDNVNTIVVTAMALVVPTVIGRCRGAGDFEQLNYFVHKLIRITYAINLVLQLSVLALLPWILRLFSLSDEARHYAFILVVIHNILTIFISPFSTCIGPVLRSVGDVKYTMVVSCLGLLIGRLACSYLFSVTFGLEIIGMWLAMGTHWSMTAIANAIRYRSGKWKTIDIIR